jgi:hypothetical protein
MHFPVGDPLLAPRQLRQLSVDLLFLGEDALFDLQRLGPSRSDFLLDLRAQADRFLPGLDLRLAAEGVGVSARLGDQEVARPACRGESRGRRSITL